jgi:hypothetical protein
MRTLHNLCGYHFYSLLVKWYILDWFLDKHTVQNYSTVCNHTITILLMNAEGLLLQKLFCQSSLFPRYALNNKS